MRFGGTGNNSINASAVRKVIIRIPVPRQSYIDYDSFLVTHNISMLFGLNVQRLLQCVTSKDDTGPESIDFRTIGLRKHLTFQHGHLYYVLRPSEICALIRSYSTETIYADFQKLCEIKKVQRLFIPFTSAYPLSSYYPTRSYLQLRCCYGRILL